MSTTLPPSRKGKFGVRVRRGRQRLDSACVIKGPYPGREGGKEGGREGVAAVGERARKREMREMEMMSKPPRAPAVPRARESTLARQEMERVDWVVNLPGNRGHSRLRSRVQPAAVQCRVN